MGSPAVLYKYFAFLSYSHRDAGAAAALSRYIETFRVPTRLGGREQQLPKRLFPIFRDREELAASPDLGASIREALAQSGALVVLCSPASAQSQWVNEEIRTFRRSGRTRIFAVLLEGEPATAFPPALTQDGLEPLAVDFRPGKDSRSDARLRLVAALLGVAFDALKRRDAQRRRAQLLRLGATLAAIAIASAAYLLDQPRFVSTVPVEGTISQAVVSSGNLWFYAYDTGGLGDDRIGSIGSHGALHETRIGDRTDNLVFSPAVDGGAWFSRKDVLGAQTFAHIDTAGAIVRVTPDVAPVAIAATKDRTWFVESPDNPDDNLSYMATLPPASHTIGRTRGIQRIGLSYNLVPSGASVYFSITNATRGTSAIGKFDDRMNDSYVDLQPYGTAVGSLAAADDGSVWFTEQDFTTVGPPGRIGRLTRDGKLHEYLLPAQPDVAFELLPSSDGSVWFTSHRGIEVRHPDGSFAHFAAPGNGGAWSLVEGSDGAIWFLVSGSPAEHLSKTVVRMTRQGKISVYPAPGGVAITQLLRGPGRTLWYTTEHSAGRLDVGHWFFGV